jgi:hypothetical protein
VTQIVAAAIPAHVFVGAAVEATRWTRKIRALNVKMTAAAIQIPQSAIEERATKPSIPNLKNAGIEMSRNRT